MILPKSKRKRFARLRAVAFAVIALFAGATSASPQESKQTPPPRSFDYWQPDWMMRELWGPGHMSRGMMVRLLRHYTYVNYGVPKEYEGAKSPLLTGPEMTKEGGRLYAEKCASCHGKDGMGDSDASNALSPSPALLAYMITRPISVDEYLLWAISDGGKQFDTVMPAFKDLLTREDIWKIIGYMRAGFPDLEATTSAK